MKTQQTYIKCPRCELNYILKKDKYCEVCKMEMKAGSLEDNDLDDLDEGLELCPICKSNYLQEGETICQNCQEEQLTLADKPEDTDWRSFVEKTDEQEEDLDLLPVEDNEIDEELDNAFSKDLDEDDKEREEEDEDDEDFEKDDFDDFDDFDDDLDEEDDDDEDGEEEDEDENGEDDVNDDIDDLDDLPKKKK